MAIKKLKMPSVERVMEYCSPEPYWIIPTEKGDWSLSSKLILQIAPRHAPHYTSRDGFHAVSMPEYFDLFEGVYKLRNESSEVDSLRRFIRKAFMLSPLTLTSIDYMPAGKDIVTHNYKKGKRKIIREDIAGKEGLISKVLSINASLALTGKKPEEVGEIMQYIVWDPAYICRSDVKPRERTKRLAGLSVSLNNKSTLGCRRDPYGLSDLFPVKFNPH